VTSASWGAGLARLLPLLLALPVSLSTCSPEAPPPPTGAATGLTAIAGGAEGRDAEASLEVTTPPAPPPLEGRLVVPPVQGPDPTRVQDRYTNLVASALFLPLALPAGEPGPWIEAGGGGLARSLEVSGRTLTIRLDPAFRWDAAHPVTARDLERAWRRKLAGATAADLGFVEDARCTAAKTCPDHAPALHVVDDSTLVVSCAEPPAHPEALLAFANFSPVPSWLSDTELDGEWWRQWSYGPYRVLRWDETGFLLERHPAFPDPVLTPRWQGLVSRDGEFSRAAFKRGLAEGAPAADRVDWVAGPVPVGDVPGLERDLPGSLFREPLLCLFGFFVRGLSPEARQALYCGFDRDDVTLHFLGGGQLPAYDVIPPDFGRRRAARYLGACPKVPELGRAVSGHRPLRVLCNPEGGSDRVCTTLLEGVRQRTGLAHAQTTAEWRSMLEAWKKGEHDLLRYSLCGTVEEASFLEAFETGHPSNLNGYSSAPFDGAVADLRSGAGPREERLEGLAEVLRQDLPFLPVYQSSQLMLVRPGTTGLTANDQILHPLQRVGVVR